MKKNAKIPIGTYRNSTWRFLAKIIGEQIEKEIGLEDNWRTPSGWGGIKEIFNNECIYCGIKEGEKVTITSKRGEREVTLKLEREHLKSISKGGLDIKANIAPACRICNLEKSDDVSWENFFDQIEKLTDEERKKRKNKVLEYINEKCMWEEVQKHPLFSMNTTLITTDFIEKDVLSWIREWTNEGLYNYVYHITTEKEIQGKLDFYPLNRNVIKCCFEHHLGIVISDYIEPGPSDDLVLLAIKLESLDKLNIKYEKVYNKSLVPFIHILDKVPTSEIHFSKTFNLVDDCEQLKESLRGFEFSLARSGKEFLFM